MTARFYRSTREAFPVERFPAVFGPYRSHGSALRTVWQLAVVLTLFAVIGVLIGAGA